MKKTLIGAVAVFGATFGLVLFLGSADGHAQGKSSIQQGAAIAPVPLDLAGLNPALVRQGSYIVNAQGGCTIVTPRRHTPRAATPSSGSPK